MAKSNENFKFISDKNSIEVLRKRFTLSRMDYRLKDSKLISILFKIDHIKPKNYKILQKLLNILVFSTEIENLSLQTTLFSIEKEQFLTLLQIIFQIKNVKFFSIMLQKMKFEKEIVGYFTKFLIVSFRNLLKLEINFSHNNFGDDGVFIFALGVVNLKHLNTIKLDFSETKMSGSGLITLIENLNKNLENLELICDGINNKDISFQKNYGKCLKLLKMYSELKTIALNFSSNFLTPYLMLKTLKLFLKNQYFDKLLKVALDLHSNVNEIELWKKIPNKSKTKTITQYNKYLEELNLNLSFNEIQDCDFRYFYDILIFFKGLKKVSLNLNNNCFHNFRSNIFFIFSSIGYNLGLENVSIDLSHNTSIRHENFSVNGDHLPRLFQLKFLSIKTSLPKTSQIEIIFSTFLEKFENLENLLLHLEEDIEAKNMIPIANKIAQMKKLKFLDLEFSYTSLHEDTFKKIFYLFRNLKNLCEIRFFAKPSKNQALPNFLKLSINDFYEFSSLCRNLRCVTLYSKDLERTDTNFKINLLNLARRFLMTNIFLDIEGDDKISKIFVKKKSKLMIAIIVKSKLKSIYKRNVILNEIFEIFQS